MRIRHALRVALVWNGTVVHERVMRLPSDRRRLTIGSDRRCDLVIAGDDVPERFELFSRHQGGYALTVPRGTHGRLQLGESQESAEDWWDKTLFVVPGHHGLLEIGAVTLFFQFVEDDVIAPRRALLGRLDGPLAGALWFSLVAQFVVVFLAQLLWDEELAQQEYSLDPRTLNILAVEPPAAELEPLPEPEDHLDDDTSARAEGPEGQVGPPDATADATQLPDHEGPLVDRLPTSDLGRALEQALGVDGALTNVFAPNDLMAHVGTDFDSAGEGDALVLGPGTNGMALHGLDDGGGGNGFGQVGGVGEIQGRGPGTTVDTNTRRRPRRPIVDVRPPLEFVDSGFLSASAIQEVVRRHRRGIRNCYESQLTRHPALEGRIVVNWTIDFDGTVSRRAIEANTTDSRELAQCLLQEVRRMRFPEPDGGLVVVAFPFTFQTVEQR